MVDFEGGKRGGFDADNGSEEAFDVGSNEFQESSASYSAGTRFLVPDANGVIVLPEGARLEDMSLQGGDLVVTLADGTVYVFTDAVFLLPDGTIFVPQIVSEGVQLDPTDVLELLDPQGPGLPELPVRGSGGNFAEDPGSIQDAFDLGDLLPYTELSRIVEEDEEVLPFENNEPEVVIETPDNPIGVENAIATVEEAGLPERGGEGTEPEGTASETDSETTTGTIRISSPDGIAAVLINGEEVTSIGQGFVSPFGTLTITSIDLDSGIIGVSYTLDDNLLGETVDGFFSVTVVDSDGDQASASLSIIVVDDAPIAINDTNTVPGGSHDPIMGNVVDNDESGADDFPVDGAVTGFSNASGSADPGDTLQGEFGTLMLNADGTYTYIRDFNTPGGVEESFDYDIVDQDGSTSSATLLIVIGDAPTEITFVPEVGEGTEVDEGGLPPRGDEPVGSGEGADNDPNNNSDPSENTGATITFESPDGVGSITIDGTPIDIENLPQTIIVDGGTLVITDVTYDPVTGNGTITYDFTLDDNTAGDDTTIEFEIAVTDLDGDTAEDTVVIHVVDDVPEAVDDNAAQTAENAPITVDVFANDIEGADGVELTAIAAVDGTLSGAGGLVYNGDGTFTYTPAAGEEGTVTFDYTITDGDGDVSTATVTIALLPDSTPEISVEGLDTVDEAGLAARDGEPAGSDEAANSEFATGSIPIDTGNDTIASLVINGVDVTAGGTVPTDKGVLTITLTDGEYSYSYELTDNTLSDPDTDAFELVVTDSDGDTASTDLVINILDDVPEAVDDTDSLDEGGPISTSGNVITDAEANGDNGADTVGADGAVVQNAGNIAGTYGDLVLGADGSYTYTLTDFGISQLETLSDGEFFTEVFDYTLVDGDGDTAPAKLTITLNGEDDIVTVNGLDGQAPEVSLDEDDLANVGDDQGSDQSDLLFQNGSFGVTSPDGLDDVQVNGVDVVVDGVFTAVEVANDGVYSVTVTGWTPTFAADGTTVISATFDYTATLLDNTLAHTGLNDAALVEMLTVTADDVDGSSDSAVLDVEIVDDTPTAVDDTDSVVEGQTADGNVITGVGGSDANNTDGVADISGADGYSDAGPVVSVRTQDGNNIDATPDGAGNYIVTSALGTLTINQDGSYTYASVANSTNADTTDTFIYTIRDGDGDESEAELVIDIENVAGQVSDNGALVFEAGLDGIGSDAGSDSETFTTGQISVTDATGPFVYVLTDPGPNPEVGNYGTLTLNTDGSYSYTLTAPVDGDSITPDQGGDNGNNQVSDQESFSYSVFDQANNLIGSGTIVVTIEDDVPSVELELSSGSVDMLITQDADTDPGPDTATSDISDAFTVTTETYGADQPGTLEISYEMTLLAAVDGVANATGLFSGADEIFVYKIGDTVVGSTSLVAPVVASDPSVVFTIDVASDTGVVTLTQISEITHADNNDTSAPYDDQLAELASGLVGVTATATITDADGDVDSDPETYDLGNLVRFADDGPSITANANDGAAPKLTTFDELTENAAFDTDVSIANFSGAFTIASSDAGADEPGTVDWDFDLRIDDANSGLSSDGNPITLYSIGGEVVGSTAAVIGDVDASNTIFSIAVDGDGIVTLTQFAEIDHADNGDTSAPYNDQFAVLADGKVSLLGEATITDADQDEASSTVELDLGGNIRFADDGPSLSDVMAGAAVSVDESDAATPGTFSISATSLASVITFTSDFGADGEKDTEYTISVLDALGDPVASTDSGLQTADGDLPITLEQTSDTVITGTFNGGADEAFVITINPDGTVTLEQKVALEHLVDGDDVVVDHNDVLNLAGKIGATVTITDGDDDEASESVEIGSNLSFFDDGPSVSASNNDDNSVVAVTSDADITDFDTLELSNLFSHDSDYGTDGQGGADSVVYGLDIVGGSGINSGLESGGSAVFLYKVGEEVIGSTQTPGGGNIDGTNIVFIMSPDTATGTLTLTQYMALDHTDNGSSTDDQLVLNDSLINATYSVTVEDSDGDTATTTETVDLGGNIAFNDDTPTAETTLTAFLDDDTQGGNPGGPDDQNPDTSNTTGSLVDDVEGFGNDGGTVAFSLAGAPAGFQYVTDGNGGVFIQQLQDGNFVTVVTVTLNTSTGDYTVTQNANILHADDGNNDENEQDFTLNATLTDGDGDTAPAVLNITVDDDTPIANSGAAITGLVDEDGLLGGIDDDSDLNDVPGAAVSDNGVVDSLFTAGADAPLTFGLDDSSTAALDALGLTSDGATVTYTITGTSVVAVAGATPIFTFTLNSDGEWAFNLEGSLDHEIAIDGENVNDIEIDFGSLIQATDADGDTVNATGSLTVTVDDDTPVANLDADIADEGETVVGNVLTNDLGGADGLESPAITGIGSTNEGTSDNTVTAGEFVLAGEFGTLTLNETTGDYSYDVPADSITVGGDDVFTYTIIDIDGDEVSTTLTFAVTPVNLSGNAPSVTVFEEAMDLVNDAGDVAASTVTGSAPTETTESDTGTVVVAGATEFGIQGGSSAGGFTTLVGIYGTIVIDEATGDFTYTLTSPLSTTPGVDDGVTTNIGETFTYTAQDADGNGTTGIIFINVVDDVPTAAISAAGLALAHDETVGVQGDAQDVAGPLAAFAGVSNAGDDPDVAGTVIGYAQDLSGVVSTGTEFGADGAGTTTFSLAVSASGVDSGLNTTEGTDIVLYKEGDLIVGRVGDQSGEAAFAIAIDASTGGVSMVQYLSVFNPIGGTSSPDEAVSIAAGAVQAVVTVTDGDGDANSASTNIGGAISFQDDAGTLGAFNDLDLVNAANAMDFGTFAYDTGADGHGQFNITGPALDGVLYQPLDHGLVDATDDGVNNPVNGTTLTATTLDGSETLFTLSLDENGNSKFTLVTPDAGSTEVIDLTSLAAAGPLAFNETSDGRIEFSSTTGGVNSSTPGFGVANQFVSAGEQFQVEFHNPGTTGDDATLTNAEFFNSAQLANNRDGGNVVYKITIFNDADGTFEVVYTGQILGPVTDIVPITLTEFNRFEVEGISGGGQGARFSTLSLTKTILPQDLNLDFNVTAIDGDFDFTSTQVINVEVDASAPAMAAASSGSATTASAFTTTALLDDGSDIGGTGGSGGLLGGGTTSFSNDNDLMMQTALRGMGSTQIAAAGFGAMMVNFSEMTDGVGNLSVTDGSGFQGFAETSYELASFEAIDSGFNTVVELPQTTGDLSLFASTSLTQFDSFEFIGMNPMAESNVQAFEFGGSSDFVSDAYSGVMSGTGAALNVGADMEALLALNDDGIVPVDLAQASGLRGDQDIDDLTVAIEEIVNDLMAGDLVDTMIEHFAGEVTGFTGEMSYLADNALAQSIDGGAFTFGASSVADMTEDAAAMAAVHA